MKYKFVFTNNRGSFDRMVCGTFGRMTYECERESYDRTAKEMFHDARCLLDFDVFNEVRMFDENGRELTELY